jgi:CheY-like chemotaxis protein
MNGGIQVESELGAGTTFRLFLPLVPAITTPIVDIPRPLPSGNERILLVDDDAMVLATLESMLSNLGYQVVAMANPQQALERFQADPAAFNLLLTDLTMPGMTGHDLIAKVRSLQPGMHALLMTGVLDMEEANEHGTSKPDGILTKPFSNHAVAGMIRMVLNR